MVQTTRVGRSTFKFGQTPGNPGKTGTWKSPRVWIPPVDDVVFESDVQFASKVQTVDSISTPAWAAPKPRYVQVTSFKRLKKAPRKPVEPSPPVMLPLPQQPIRRPNTTDKQYQRALRKWGERRWKIEAINRRREHKFLYIYARYKEKLKYFENGEALRRKKTFRSKLVGKIIHTVNNPYSKVIVEDSGWEYNCVRQEYGQIISDYTFNLNVSRYAPNSVLYLVKRLTGKRSSQVYPAFAGLSDVPFASTYLPSNDLVIAEKKAREQLFEKLNEQKVHVGNIIAERAQTFGMLQSSIQRLQGFLRSPKKTVLNYLRSDGNMTKRLADDGLVYAFGVEPLVSDVYNSATAFNDALKKSQSHDMIKVRSGGSYTSKSEQVIKGPFYTDYVTTECVTRVRYMCEYRITSPAAVSLNSLGLINPAEILWEVTPWSFVIDWFLPIGDFISSLTADQGLVWKSGTTSTLTTITYTSRRIFDPNYIHQSQKGLHFYGEIKRTKIETSKKRTLLNAAPVPALPRFKNPFSGRHVLLSLALWRQRV